MAGLRVHFVMPAELVERIDAAAHGGGVSRGEFVRRAVERALGGVQGAKWPSTRESVPSDLSAPAEQPEMITTPEIVARAARAGVFDGRLRTHAANCKCPVCS